MALPPSLPNLLQIDMDKPLCSPTMAVASSVIIPITFLHGSFISLIAAQTERNQSVALVWHLRVWMSTSSSVMFMSTPLKSINSCAVSHAYVLSSQANEKNNQKSLHCPPGVSEYVTICPLFSVPQCHKPGKQWQILASSQGKCSPQFS